jgi:signal transduction histidine kinase
MKFVEKIPQLKIGGGAISSLFLETLNKYDCSPIRIREMPLTRFKIPNRNYFYIIAGFSIVIILAAILLALYTITDNYKSLSYLDKSYGINTRIDKIHSILKDEENQQRGYLITYRPVFLKTFDYSKKAVRQEYQALYEVLKNEKAQQRNLIALGVELEHKLSILETGKNYFETRHIRNDSLRKILAQGDFVMDKLRKTITQMKKVEYKRFSMLRERTFTKSELSIFIIALTSGISILLLISILLALKREQRSKNLIQEKLMASEKRLQQQVILLNNSNKELEQFAYIASHDLEEPLRKISSFSEKIQIKLDNYPDEDVIDSLKRLNKSVSRMRVLIRDLLNYSRITRMLNINEQVNLDQTFRLIAEDLSLALAAKNARLTVDPLDEIRGNNTQIRQLFQNLISNALKFSDKEVPEIHISAGYYTQEELAGTGWMGFITPKHRKYYCISVKDNGIGFELQYLQQIFIIFQRLHGRSEYEGTGIGLAICKRIVENHEGFISAESEVGKGAVFIVGLPVD